MKTTALALATLLVLSGCAAHMHQVGSGALPAPAPTTFVSKKQVYALNWIPINEVDTHEMAMGHDHYVITTERDLVDSIIAAATLGIITTRTVTVEFNPELPADPE